MEKFDVTTINDDVNRFYEFGLVTKEAILKMINEWCPRLHKDDVVSIAYRDADGVLKREIVEAPTSAPQKIVPIRCTCCGGKIVNNKCIYCDTEFYVER
jgi:hypothetical protein